MGGNISLGFTEIGVEYTDNNTTISPYRVMRYYLNAHRQVKRILLSVNCNYRDYNMVEEETHRRYADVTGIAAWQFAPSSKIDLSLGYRQQRGPGVDLDLLTARSELKSQYRKLFVTLGVNLYRRNYMGDITNFSSIYMDVARRF